MFCSASTYATGKGVGIRPKAHILVFVKAYPKD